MVIQVFLLNEFLIMLDSPSFTSIVFFFHLIPSPLSLTPMFPHFLKTERNSVSVHFLFIFFLFVCTCSPEMSSFDMQNGSHLFVSRRKVLEMENTSKDSSTVLSGYWWGLAHCLTTLQPDWFVPVCSISTLTFMFYEVNISSCFSPL